VYAKWTGETYTVTFKRNYVPDTTLYTKTVTVPATAIGAADFPANPSRSGYIFGGWYTGTNGTGNEITASTTVNGDITVYAQWTGETYTVMFNNNGGDTEANPASKTVTSPNITIDALPAPPSKAGYAFVGWYTGTGSQFTVSTPVTDNITVYAEWNSYSYTITFNNSGGDTAANPGLKIVATPNTTIDVLPVPPSKTGYAFGGWYTGTNGTGTSFTASTPVTGDITVYAWWTSGGLITLDPDAGDGAFSQGNFTISKPNGSQTITITGSGYTNPRWIVDGTLKGTSTSITIRAADYTLGGHALSLFIVKDGGDWSKDISFTVIN
jgi:uncharacterized repeat protein (TIGR02543 family)